MSDEDKEKKTSINNIDQNQVAEIVQMVREEVSKQEKKDAVEGAAAVAPADAGAVEGKGVGKLEGEGEGKVEGVDVKPTLSDAPAPAQADVDNNAPEKMYDIDGVPGTDTVKHIYNNLGEVNAARLLKDFEPLAELKIGGRRRSTRRRHKKSSKKSRRQSKKGGKKHRKRTSKKGGKGKKRSQRKH